MMFHILLTVLRHVVFAFEDYIKTHSSDTETRKTHLSDICRTRWVECVEGMDTFTELFAPIHHPLCNMKDNVEGEFRPNLVTDANLHLIFHILNLCLL